MQSAGKSNVHPHATAGGSPASGSRTSQESGAMPAADARRAHVRHDVEIEVSLESESNFYMGLTENLSEGGLFIATHLVKPIGTEIEVSFKLPHVAEPIKAKGAVKWIREYSETSDAMPGMGVRFERIAQQQVEQIREFLAARAPLFYDED
jgi:type IV pilus assembly protein PilZ